MNDERIYFCFDDLTPKGRRTCRYVEETKSAFSELIKVLVVSAINQLKIILITEFNSLPSFSQRGKIQALALQWKKVDKYWKRFLFILSKRKYLVIIRTSELESPPLNVSKSQAYLKKRLIFIARILAVGSYQEHNKAELLNKKNNNWTDVAPINYPSKFGLFAIIFYKGGFFVFGGQDGNMEDKPGIQRFDEEKREWSWVGRLRNPRRGHGVIHDGETFVVAGGTGQTIENCIWRPELAKRRMVCKENSFNLTLQNYISYPELAIVHDEFESEC